MNKRGIEVGGKNTDAEMNKEQVEGVADSKQRTCGDI